MIEQQIYDNKFYENRSTTLRSAEIIIPDLLKLMPIKSVVDIGCGPAEWLGVFERHGISDVLGFDGEWVDKKILHIQPEKFVSADLKQPISLARTFDLAVSLEVAEHLPESVAQSFIESLTRLAPAVLFSAAIPLQGGAYHLNEQWPSYWARLFANRGYKAVDCVRKSIWTQPEVCWWYSQNCLLYVKEELLQSNDLLRAEALKTNENMLNLIHPRLFTYYTQRHNTLLGLIPTPLKWLYRKFLKKQ